MAKHCPKCDRETEVPKVTYGLNRIRCKSCNHVFTVMAYVIVEVKK